MADPIVEFLAWIMSQSPQGRGRSTEQNMALAQNALGMGTMAGGVKTGGGVNVKADPWLGDLLAGGPKPRVPNDWLASLIRESGSPAWKPEMLAGMRGATQTVGTTAQKSGTSAQTAANFPLKKLMTLLGLGGAGAGAVWTATHGSGPEPTANGGNSNYGSMANTDNPVFASNNPLSEGGMSGDFLARLMGLVGGGGETESQRINAQANMLQAQAQRARYEAQTADDQARVEIAKRDLALKAGQLDQAREFESNAQEWRQRAADANDRSNQISANRGIGDLAGTADKMVMDRGTLQARGAEGLTALGGVVGRINQDQQELALKMNSTPRNAIAAMLMGRGQPATGAAGFTASAPSGISNMLMPLLQKAFEAAQNVGNVAPPQFDLGSAIQSLRDAANRSTMAQQPAPPTDQSGMRVGARFANPAVSPDAMLAPTPISSPNAGGDALARLIRGDTADMFRSGFRQE